MFFVKELRDAAHLHHKASIIKELHFYADKIDEAIDDFKNHQSSDNLRMLNGIWAAAYMFLSRNPPPEPSNPRGAKMRQQERKVA